jgi:hypothetical protein
MNVRKWVGTAVLCALVLGIGHGAIAREGVRISSIEVVGGSQPVIYVLDNANDELVVVDGNGALVRRIPLTLDDGKNSQAYGLIAASPKLGDVFVIGNRPGVRIVAGDGTIQPYIASMGPFTDRIPGIDPNGVFYFPDREANKVKVYNVHAGAVPQAEAQTPDQKAVPVNNTEVLEFDTDKPERTLNGAVSGPAHMGRPGEVHAPSTAGAWVLDQTYAFTVFRWTPGNSRLEFTAKVKAPDKANRAFTEVTGIRCDGQGNTYLACPQIKSILVYDKDFKLAKTIPTGFKAYGLAVGADGRLYIGDDHRNSLGDLTPEIKVLDRDGAQLQIIQMPAAEGQRLEVE